MKNFIKILSVLLIAALVLPANAFAAENKSYADTLFEMGLFKGTDKGYELDKTFTREEAATILVRLLGEEKNSQKQVFGEVFEDVLPGRWSYPFVMYCYENDITKGTAATTFSPSDNISADRFLALILRLLGYTGVEPETAFKESIHKGILNSEKAKQIENAAEFLRGDMVYIVYRSLMCKMQSGKLLADVLAEKGTITAEQAKQFNLYESTDNIDDLIDGLLG